MNQQLNLSDEVLNRRVFNQHYYDLHSQHFMLSQTKNYITDSTVIDVGAAVGMYTKFFAQYANSVTSYEAVPPVYEQLLKIHKECLNTMVWNKGVSDKVGTSTFYVDDKRLSNSGFQDLVGGQPIEVETTTLDEMHLKHTPDICFIKIDTEGTELDVLNGGQKLIDKHKPHLMIEIYEKYNKYPVETSFKFCFDRGYKCYYNHKGKGLVEVPSIESGVKIVKTMVDITDGDFLFVNGNRITK
jgi:FkbM family methyltransferase|tara:strand:+ start:640 stop:1365 length:726 start_codon:yes stop_codon:yes gene_type:complete